MGRPAQQNYVRHAVNYNSTKYSKHLGKVFKNSHGHTRVTEQLLIDSMPGADIR